MNIYSPCEKSDIAFRLHNLSIPVFDVRMALGKKSSKKKVRPDLPNLELNVESSSQAQEYLNCEEMTPIRTSKRDKSKVKHSRTITDEDSVMNGKLKVKKEKKTPEVKLRNEKLLKKKALKYLKIWQKNRSNWKFEKLRQVWLLQNMFDTSKVPEKKFPVLVEYLLGAKGSARKLIVEKALQVIQMMEQWTELLEQGLDDSETMDKNTQLQKVSEESYNRARLVLQSLKEDQNV